MSGEGSDGKQGGTAVTRVGATSTAPRRHWPFYAGIAALVVFDLVEWPVAALVAVGHMLSENRHSEILEELGEAIEEAD